MKLQIVILLAAVSSQTVALCQDAGAEKATARPELKTDFEKASFLIGYNVGVDLQQQGLEVDLKALSAGISASLAGEERGMAHEDVKAAFDAFRAEMQKRKAAKAAANLEAGRKFLEANKSKDGVKVTKSGLQYIVLKAGSGKTPTTDDSVSTHYKGTLISGKQFDASYEGDDPAAGDTPASFGVTQVIPGWTEALQLMPVGSKYRLFVPGELAYGEAGFPPLIGPNQVLVFDLELIAIE